MSRIHLTLSKSLWVSLTASAIFFSDSKSFSISGGILRLPVSSPLSEAHVYKKCSRTSGLDLYKCSIWGSTVI